MHFEFRFIILSKLNLIVQPGAVGLIVIGIIAIHCMLLLLDVANVLYKRFVAITMELPTRVDVAALHRKGCTALNYAEVAVAVTKDFTGKKHLGIAYGYGKCDPWENKDGTLSPACSHVCYSTRILKSTFRRNPGCM